MSSESTPITASRFAAALRDLSPSSLHAKVSELRNSIAHLEASNAQLEEFVRQDNDKDCYEALVENKEVIRRMQERIELVRREIVENRGMLFEPEEKGEVKVDGIVNGNGNVAGSGENRTRESGTEEAERREEEGVFL